jgi:hypothetical protein
LENSKEDAIAGASTSKFGGKDNLDKINAFILSHVPRIYYGCPTWSNLVNCKRYMKIPMARRPNKFQEIPPY